MGLDHSKLQRRRTKSSGPGFRIRDGDNRIRILPPTSEYFTKPGSLEDLAVQFRLHFFKREGQTTQVMRCFQDVGQPCPACDAWRKYRKSDDVGMAAQAKQISPSDQYLFNVIDLNNPQGGIQQFQSNWTCWDKIMEIASNPAWGDVIHPEHGVNFVITRTSGDKSRSGYPTYSVLPEPNRSSVVEILAAVPDWQNVLDTLEDGAEEPGDTIQMTSLLAEVGFPGYGTTAPVAQPPAQTYTPPPATPLPWEQPTAPTPPPPPPPPPTASAPPAAPTPPPPPPPPAVPIPGTPPAAAPPAAPTPPPPPAPEALTTVHYDPGPEYQPKVEAANRPAGAPRCFADFNPRLHACPTCPVQADCQIAYLKMA